MNNLGVWNSLLNLLGAAAVLALIYGPLQSFIVDAVRQRFFEIRDDVFDAAAQGKIAFNDPHYVEFRNTMNALLRNARELTIWRMAVLMCAAMRFVGKPPAAESNPFANAPQVIQQAHRKAILWLGVLMWLRSPMAIVISTIGFGVIVPACLIAAATSSTVRTVPAKLMACVQRGLRKEAALEVMLFRGAMSH